MLNDLIKQGKPLIMGILNVTPDSFSDGGSHTVRGRAVTHALQMVEEGADIIDVGGESTRPDAERVSPEEQIRRVAGTIEALRRTLPKNILISIDTTLSEVASAAIDAGANILNDVRAGRDDEDMFKLAAERDLPLILMHMQGTPKTMQKNPSYEDVVVDIESFLEERSAAAIKAGVKKENIIIDPGIGFGKTQEHNLMLLAHLDRFVKSGYPVLLGTSRKRFMGAICQGADPQELIGATCATTSLGVIAGVQIFRVHDVKPNRQAADVTFAINNA